MGQKVVRRGNFTDDDREGAHRANDPFVDIELSVTNSCSYEITLVAVHACNYRIKQPETSYLGARREQTTTSTQILVKPNCQFDFVERLVGGKPHAQRSGGPSGGTVASPQQPKPSQDGCLELAIRRADTVYAQCARDKEVHEKGAEKVDPKNRGAYTKSVADYDKACVEVSNLEEDTASKACEGESADYRVLKDKNDAAIRAQVQLKQKALASMQEFSTPVSATPPAPTPTRAQRFEQCLKVGESQVQVDMKKCFDRGSALRAWANSLPATVDKRPMENSYVEFSLQCKHWAEDTQKAKASHCADKLELTPSSSAKDFENKALLDEQRVKAALDNLARLKANYEAYNRPQPKPQAAPPVKAAKPIPSEAKYTCPPGQDHFEGYNSYEQKWNHAGCAFPGTALGQGYRWKR